MVVSAVCCIETIIIRSEYEYMFVEIAKNTHTHTHTHTHTQHTRGEIERERENDEEHTKERTVLLTTVPYPSMQRIPTHPPIFRPPFSLLLQWCDG